jgi:hypothetical protein
LAFLKVRIRTEELDVSGTLFQAAAVLDDLLQTHSNVSSGANSTFSPWRIDELVTVARVVIDLLDTTRSTALKCHGRRHARELAFILKLLESNLLRLIDHALYLKVVFLGIDFRNTTMIADVVVRIGSDFSLTELVIAWDFEVWSRTCLNQAFL